MILYFVRRPSLPYIWVYRWYTDCFGRIRLNYRIGQIFDLRHGSSTNGSINCLKSTSERQKFQPHIDQPSSLLRRHRHCNAAARILS